MYEPYITSHSPMWKTPAQYAEAKLKILRRDFKIKPTDEEVSHLKSLKTQTAIDNAYLGIINKHWD